MIENIFAPLYQQYQKCRDDRRTILINQAGITIGNLQLVAPFGVLLILILGYAYRYLCFHADDQETYENLCNLHYSKTEKQKALEAFAIALLIQRDHIIVDRFKGIDNPALYDEDTESATLKKLVANVVDHYNNPDTRSKVIEFLSISKQSMQKVSPKSTPPNEEILAASTVKDANVNIAEVILVGGGQPTTTMTTSTSIVGTGHGVNNRERDVEMAYEKLSTQDGNGSQGSHQGLEMANFVPRQLEEDNELTSNP